MIIKCVECEITKDVSKEDIDKIISIIENGQIPKSRDYLEVFNITKGKCVNQGRHTFIFEESFFANVQDLINKHNDISSKRKEDENGRAKTEEYIIDLESKLKSAKEKKEKLTENITNFGDEIDRLMHEFENITGSKNIEMWS